MSTVERMAEWARVRKEAAQRVRAKTGSRCYYCGETVGDEMVIDHFVPYSKCGHDDEGNLVPACRPCNSSKGDREIEEWRTSKRLKIGREQFGIPFFAAEQIAWMAARGVDVLDGVPDVTFWFERGTRSDARRMNHPPHPKGPFHIGKIGDVPRILDAKGRDVMTMPGGMERLVECANAIRHDVWFPVNHVSTLETDVVKLEQLRKEAWSLAQSRGAAA